VAFKGRSADLGLLQGRLDVLGRDHGVAVVVTGRRRVGKSRLVQEFCDRSGLPYVIFQATRRRNPAAERAELVAAVSESTLPGAELVAGFKSDDWNHALRTLALAMPENAPAIVVMDEVPWLIEQDSEFEGALQTVWDRYLSAKPVLLLLVGSDLSVMERLTTYDRPFFGRAAKMTVRPLHLGDVAVMTGLPAEGAVDALLLTGGFPEIVQSWERGMSRSEFLCQALASPLSPLLAAGELTLLGEFPKATLSRAVLESVGSGEQTFAGIAEEAGGGEALAAGSLVPVLRALIAKGVLQADLPLSMKTDTKNKRYRVADPYLRCWLALFSDVLPLIERGRADLALKRVERLWPGWRGRAVEPVVRESLLRLLPASGWPDTEAVGAWWNRRNTEIDLVGTDRARGAHRIDFVGSIKWRESKPFSTRDYDSLVLDMLAVPGATRDTPRVAVSRCGFSAELPFAATWGPEDLVQAWQ
jgi:AAA+ ATPase superfamily predicted ATPase